MVVETQVVTVQMLPLAVDAREEQYAIVYLPSPVHD